MAALRSLFGVKCMYTYIYTYICTYTYTYQSKYLLGLSSYDIVPSLTNPEIMTAAGHLDKLAPACV